MNVFTGLLASLFVGVPLFFYVRWIVRTIKARRWVMLGVNVTTLVIACAGLAYCWSRLNEWGFRRELPQSAKDIREWYHEDGFLPDYVYYLRAKVTKLQFEQYVAHFGMTPHSKDRTYVEPFRGPSWGKGPEDWWNPSTATEGSYAYQIRRDHWIISKYENGYIYLYAVEY